MVLDPCLRFLTLINGVDPVNEPWQHVEEGHHQDEGRRDPGPSDGAQVPSPE